MHWQEFRRSLYLPTRSDDGGQSCRQGHPGCSSTSTQTEYGSLVNVLLPTCFRGRVGTVAGHWKVWFIWQSWKEACPLAVNRTPTRKFLTNGASEDGHDTCKVREADAVTSHSVVNLYIIFFIPLQYGPIPGTPPEGPPLIINFFRYGNKWFVTVVFKVCYKGKRFCRRTCSLKPRSVSSS